MLNIVALVVIALISLVLGYYLRKNIAEGKIASAEDTAKKIVDDALKEAETAKKEKLLEAKEEVHALRNELERDIRERRNEIQRLERRVLQREETLERKLESLERKEEGLQKKSKEIEKSQMAVDELYKKQLEELEKLSGLTHEEARQILLHDVEKEITRESAILIKNIENQAKEEAEKKAREIIT